MIILGHRKISFGTADILTFDFSNGRVDNDAVNDGQLDPGETLTGTPTVEEQTTTDLTITSVGLNTAVVYVDKKPVQPSNAVQCLVSAGSENTQYLLKITATTDSTPARTLVFGAYLTFE